MHTNAEELRWLSGTSRRSTELKLGRKMAKIMRDTSGIHDELEQPGPATKQKNHVSDEPERSWKKLSKRSWPSSHT